MRAESVAIDATTNQRNCRNCKVDLRKHSFMIHAVVVRLKPTATSASSHTLGVA